MRRVLAGRSVLVAVLVVGAVVVAVARGGIVGATGRASRASTRPATSGPAGPSSQHDGYRCALPVLGMRSVVVTTGVRAPATARPGANLTLSGIRADLVLSAAVSGQLIHVLGTTRLSGTVERLDVLVDNVPAVINPAATAPAFGPVTMVRGRSTWLPIPGAPLAAGPFTAGPSGAIRVSIGDIALSLDSTRGPRPVGCVPVSAPPVSATTTVSGPVPRGTPAVTGIVPDVGSSAGGTHVTITGTGFSVAGTSFIFGPDDLATLVTCGSPTRCSAVAPPGTGTADVIAVSNGLPSAPDPPGDRFSYSRAP